MAYILFCFILEKAKTLIIQNRWYNKVYSCVMQNTKMDKMPRARRIFVLNKSNPETVENEIMEIASMLKFGFGRWNELMTYPFPFKFLLEYLDDACETAFSKHWKDITYKGEL